MILYEKVPSLLYECSISTSQQNLLEQSRLILKEHGFKDNVIAEIYEGNRWSLKIFSKNKRQFEFVKRIFNSFKFQELKIAIRLLEHDQWLTRWKTQWKPLSLTKKLNVVPFWYRDRYKRSKEVIFLDTVMSFGTGLHETTRLIAQLIEDNSAHLTPFLDIGTGTGILSLVALKSGAQTVTAMDISALSIEVAQSNLKANNLKANIFLEDINRLSSKQKYQCVAANLITDDLLQCRRKISNLVKPGGLLLVSGISLDNLTKLKNGFKDLPLSCRKISKGTQWAAILYVKKML